MKNPTKHKVEEAKYFLSMLKQLFEDDDEFAYNLSAFLSAARSITFYMQKQYKHRDGFAEWYCRKQIEMSADEELKYLNNARVEDIHKEPVHTGATREVGCSVDVILVPEDEQANETELEPHTQSSSKTSSLKTVRRFFPKFGEVDVTEFCESQLTKLTMIVEECENHFV